MIALGRHVRTLVSGFGRFPGTTVTCRSASSSDLTAFKMCQPLSLALEPQTISKVYDLTSLRLEPSVPRTPTPFSDYALTPDAAQALLRHHQAKDENILPWIQISVRAYKIFSELRLKHLQKPVKNWEDHNEDIYRVAEEDFRMEEIQGFISWVEINYKKLHFDDLMACVLALGCWPTILTFGFKSSVNQFTPTRIQSELYRIFTILDNASYKRLYIFQVSSPDFYITDVKRRIELAKTWVHVISENRLGFCEDVVSPLNKDYNKCRGGSFPSSLLRKACDRTTESSRRFFTKLDPELFVDFMKLLLHIRHLDDNFHKYYVIFKFYQFLPDLTLDEIALVARACIVHSLYISTKHQIGDCLANELIDAMLANIEHLESRHVGTICSLLEHVVIQSHNIQKIGELQTKIAMALEEGTVSIDIRSIIQLCSLLRNRHDHNQSLLNLLQNKFLGLVQPQNLTLRDITRVIRLAQVDAFTSSKAEILDKCRDLMISIMNGKGSLSTLEKVFANFHLISEGVFCENLLLNFFSDRKLFGPLKKYKEEWQLLPKFYFENAPQSNLIRSTVHLIQGILELNHPEYSGPKISPNSFKKGCSWLELPTPSMFPEKSIYLDWRLIGGKLKNNIANQIEKRFGVPTELVLKNYLHETSVIPFFGLTDYVMVFDSKFEPVPIPSEYLNLEDGTVKRPFFTTEAKFWVSITFLDSRKHLIFSRALEIPRPLWQESLLQIGFSKVGIIDMINYKHGLDELQDELVFERLSDDVQNTFDRILDKNTS